MKKQDQSQGDTVSDGNAYEGLDNNSPFQTQPRTRSNNDESADQHG